VFARVAAAVERCDHACRRCMRATRASDSRRRRRIAKRREGALESVSRQRAHASLIFHPRVAALSDRRREDVYCPRLDETRTTRVVCMSVVRATQRETERDRERERERERGGRDDDCRLNCNHRGDDFSARCASASLDRKADRAISSCANLHARPRLAASLEAALKTLNLC